MVLGGVSCSGWKGQWMRLETFRLRLPQAVLFYVSFVTSKRDVKTRKTEASTNLKDSLTIHVQSIFMYRRTSNY